MFKKLCLTLCLTAFMAWAQDDDFDDSDFVSAGSAPEASADESAAADEDDAPRPTKRAAMASNDDDADFADAEDGGMSNAEREKRLAEKKFEEDQRADEYANSLRRRDWLKDRFILQIGMGSRYPFMGETGMGMGFGAGAEYITAWHIALYGSFGFLPKGDDVDFKGVELEGGTAWKAGINYYLFPKNPLHLGISASYGTVYFDHHVEPKDGVRPLITVDGFQFDALITYLTNEWYYLQFSFGMYYAPKLASDSPDENPSLRYQSEGSSNVISAVVNKDGMSKTGLVFGIAIGYALPELFPDDTEKRRRQREKEREKAGRR